MLAAAQGIDFHAPFKTSKALAGPLGLIRAKVPAYEEDRFFAPDIAAVQALIAGGAFRVSAAELLPSSN